MCDPGKNEIDITNIHSVATESATTELVLALFRRTCYI